MSFAGHVIDMIKRMEQNRNLLKGKSYFKKHEKKYSPYIKKYSKEELLLVRAEEKKRIDRNQKTKRITLVVITIIVITIVTILFYYW